MTIHVFSAIFLVRLSSYDSAPEMSWVVPLLSFVGVEKERWFHQFRSLKLQCLTFWGVLGTWIVVALRERQEDHPGQNCKQLANSFHIRDDGLDSGSMALQSWKPGLLLPAWMSQEVSKRFVSRL